MAERGLYCLPTGRRFDLAEEVTIKNQGFARLHFQLSNIYSLAAELLAEFSNAYSQNVLQRRRVAIAPLAHDGGCGYQAQTDCRPTHPDE